MLIVPRICVELTRSRIVRRYRISLIPAVSAPTEVHPSQCRRQPAQVQSCPSNRVGVCTVCRLTSTARRLDGSNEISLCLIASTGETGIEPSNRSPRIACIVSNTTQETKLTLCQVLVLVGFVTVVRLPDFLPFQDSLFETSCILIAEALIQAL